MMIQTGSQLLLQTYDAPFVCYAPKNANNSSFSVIIPPLEPQNRNF